MLPAMTAARTWERLGSWAWVPFVAGCGAPTVAPDAYPDRPSPGTIARKCDALRLLEDLDPKCRRVEIKQSAATGMASEIERDAATDLDLCAAWSSGGAAPQSIAFDFGTPRSITRVIVVPEMTEGGKARHAFEGSEDGKVFEEITVMEGHLQSGVAVTAELPNAPHRFLRIKSTSSPSPIAWREVIPLSCEEE